MHVQLLLVYYGVIIMRSMLRLDYKLVIGGVLCVTSVFMRFPSTTADSDKVKDAKTVFAQDERDEQSYLYKFETSNGISRAETGDFEQITFETGIAVVKGYYSYIGSDNLRHTVTYVADATGYHPKVHKSSAATPGLPSDADLRSVIIDDADDDRIGTKLLQSLGGGPIG